MTFQGPVTDLVPSVSVENFLAQRDAMVERARAARTLVQEIESIAGALPATATGHSWFRLTLSTEPNRQDFTEDRGFESYVKAIDAACWDRLLDLSGLRTFMDAKMRQEWCESIDKCKVPELTLANVEETFRLLHDTRRDMFERGVVAVFNALSWDYKRHLPCMFGKRIILRHVYDTRCGINSVEFSGANRLDDLMRSLCILDGRPEPDHRQGAYRRLSDTKRDLDLVDFDGYFTVRGFKNGNGHLTFLQPDLVDQMNQIIAKHFPGALPPGRDER